MSRLCERIHWKIQDDIRGRTIDDEDKYMRDVCREVIEIYVHLVAEFAEMALEN